MIKHTSRQWAIARVLGGVGTALLLWGSLFALVGQAAPARATTYTVLVGTWLGRALGDTGQCGTEYGQFTFFRNEEYSYSVRSEDCAGFTLAGTYRVQTGIFTTHWMECSFLCRPGTASAYFRFINNNTFALSDSGGTYLYYRQ